MKLRVSVLHNHLDGTLMAGSMFLCVLCVLVLCDFAIFVACCTTAGYPCHSWFSVCIRVCRPVYVFACILHNWHGCVLFFSLYLTRDSWDPFVFSVNDTAQTEDVAMETDVPNEEGCGLSSSEPVAEREEPLGSVNGKPETDCKENNNGISTDETHAVR